MKKNAGDVREFGQIRSGKCFRLTEPELVCSRAVFDDGVFVKVGNGHAVRVDAGKEPKTIVPHLKQKCHVLPGKVDSSHLEDWSIINRPFTL